jgi:HEAT repeat protein
MTPSRFRVLVSALTIAASLSALSVPATEPPRRTVSEWERDLRDPSVDVRARAAQALSAFQARAIGPLTAALNDTEYRVRASAAESLVKIGPGPVIPGMIKALDSPDVPIRANAAVVLGAFGPDAKAAVPALARALKDQNLRVRELAGEALNRIAATGPATAVTFPLNCH